MFDPERSPISFYWPDQTAAPLLDPWATRRYFGGMLEFGEARIDMIHVMRRNLH